MRGHMATAAIALSAAGGAAADDGPCLELAVFTVRDAAKAGPAQAAAHRTLAGWPGFVASVRLADDGNHGLRADLVVWRTRAAAEAAADKFNAAGELAGYRAVLGEVRALGHYPLGDTDGKKLAERLAAAPLVELAVYAAKDPAAFAPAQKALHARLPAADGFLAGAGLRKHGPGDGFADVVAWRSADAHDAAVKKLMADSAHAAFFANVGEVAVFALFKPAGGKE